MRTIIRLVLTIYIAYLTLAVLVIMPLLNFLPAWYVKQTLGRELHTEIILFNPFTLSLTARNVELPERDGERFVGFRSAAVNLSLAGLWQPGWVLDGLSVDRLYIHIKQLRGGEFNFSDLLPPKQEEPAPAAPANIPGLTIHDLDFDAEQIRISSEDRAEPFSTHWDNLAIQARDLSTVFTAGRPYSLEASWEDGGELRWEGEISIPAASSSGRLALSDISLRTAWRFLKPWLNFELVDGRLHAGGHYKLDWQDGFAYRIDQGRLQLTDIAIQPQAPDLLPDTSVSLTEIAVAGIVLDGPAQHAQVDSVDVDGLGIALWSEGRRVSLAELFAVRTESNAAPANPGTTAADAGSGVQPGVAAEEDTGSGWTADVATVRLSDSRLSWRSEYTDPPLLEVNPIEAEARHISWPLSGSTGLSLSLAINKQARLAVKGDLALADGAGEISYSLQQLPLPWFNPALPAALKAKLSGGDMAVDGTVQLASYAPTVISMGGAITDFAGTVTDTEPALTSWDTVRWEQLLLKLDEHSMALEKLSIDNFAGRLHIRADGSINTQDLWVEQMGGQDSEIRQDTATAEPWKLSFPAILVTNSQIDFMDESLPIQFRTVIGDLNGEIRNLGSAAGSPGTVDIKGSVDGYAPVVLAGNARPFDSPPALDVSLTLDGVDLATLTPYSSTYAGYAIDRGLLKLSLQYGLQDARLMGNNKVLINQLKLGEKIDSDKALDIPLKLALALLTDSNGVIDLEVPVSGNIDDPSFSLGSVILGTMRNVISKAVTAPFKLLAGLVNSEQDLQRLSFAFGSATVDEKGQAKLQQLGSAMAQRPELTLLISGRLQPEADREGLRANALRTQLLESGLSPQELDSKGPAWEQAITVRYRALAPGKSDESSVQEQYLQLARNVEISDAKLLELAGDRAAAVKSYLINELQLDAGRAVIEKPRIDDANLFSGVELGVDF